MEFVVIDRPVADVFRSTPTRVFERESGELVAAVDVWDYFDFEPLGPDRTRLVQTVVLDMKSPQVARRRCGLPVRNAE